MMSYASITTPIRAQVDFDGGMDDFLVDRQALARLASPPDDGLLGRVQLRFSG